MHVLLNVSWLAKPIVLFSCIVCYITCHKQCKVARSHKPAIPIIKLIRWESIIFVSQQMNNVSKWIAMKTCAITAKQVCSYVVSYNMNFNFCEQESGRN